jgi:hypothetical protein
MNPMNIRNSGLSMAFLAALVVPWTVAGCDQPVTQCQVGHATAGAYAAVYKLVSSDGDCSAVPELKGEPVGLDDYYPVVGQTRDLTKGSVYLQIGSVYDIQQQAETCYSPPDPSTGYKGGTFYDTNTSDTTWSVGKWENYLPDADDFCHVVDPTVAQQHIPAVSATMAGSAAPGLCFTPANGCDNGNGTSNTSCVCPPKVNGMPPADDCCDTFAKYCPDDNFAPCTGDTDCATGKCSATPIKVCNGGTPDPNTGAAVGCTKDGDCAAVGGKCDTPTSASFCTNDLAIIGCASDDDCCDPADSACLKGPHGCLPGGPDVSSCHTSEIPKTDVSVAWTDIKVYNTAAAPGTQFTATQTRTTGTCEQKYQVLGVWPSVSCDDGTGKPFAPACCPGADPADGLPLGSGINPDFQVKCDPVLLLCVLDITKKGSDGAPLLPQLDDNGYPTGCPAPTTVPGAE